MSVQGSQSGLSHPRVSNGTSLDFSRTFLSFTWGGHSRKRSNDIQNRENRKMNAAAAPMAAMFCDCDAPPAMIAMQQPIPKAENIISFLRPNLSTVSTPMGEQMVCQVKHEAAIILAVSAGRPRYDWKMVAW
jgi:hypothetical protein